MERIVKKIFITKEQAEDIQKYLDAENETLIHEEAPCIEYFSVDFGNGIEADIKVCFERDTTYLDPVLFDEGCEVCVNEVSYEILGPESFEYKGVEYLVEVELEPTEGNVA